MTLNSSFTKKKEVIIHLIFWPLFIYINLKPYNYEGPLTFTLSLFSITWFIVNLATFYFNYLFILPRVFHSFNWKKALLGIGVTYLFFVSFRYITEQLVTDILFGKTNYFPGTTPYQYIFENLYFGSQSIIISSFFWLIISLIRLLEYNKQIIEEQKNTEIRFLKAQINPHFIFNTLNNIYSMVYFKSDNSLKAIEKLSQIMRFTTYEFQKESIPMSEEINYINAYIELEKLRHTDTFFITFDIENQAEKEINIAPYILSPFVENALKHGSFSEENPIQILLNISEGEIHFSVINKIGKQQKDKLGGIGLENLKKRLEINYANKHVLTYTKESEVFRVDLQINL